MPPTQHIEQQRRLQTSSFANFDPNRQFSNRQSTHKTLFDQQRRRRETIDKKRRSKAEQQKSLKRKEINNFVGAKENSINKNVFECLIFCWRDFCALLGRRIWGMHWEFLAGINKHKIANRVWEVMRKLTWFVRCDEILI
jgi:hypothetical protein